MSGEISAKLVSSVRMPTSKMNASNMLVIFIFIFLNFTYFFTPSFVFYS